MTILFIPTRENKSIYSSEFIIALNGRIFPLAAKALTTSLLYKFQGVILHITFLLGFYRLAFIILLLESAIAKTSVSGKLTIISSNDELVWLTWNSTFWYLSLHVHILNLFLHSMFGLSVWKLYLPRWCRQPSAQFLQCLIQGATSHEWIWFKHFYSRLTTGINFTAWFLLLTKLVEMIDFRMLFFFSLCFNTLKAINFCRLKAIFSVCLSQFIK